MSSCLQSDLTYFQKEQGKCMQVIWDRWPRKTRWRWSVVLELLQAHRHPSWSWTNSLAAPPFRGSWCPFAGVQMAEDSEYFFQLTHHARTKALPSLNHAVSQYSQPPPKASNESISLLPGEEDIAQKRQKEKPTLFSYHSHLSTATSLLPRQLLSISYNLCWMQKDGEDTGKLYHSFHQTP